MLFFPKAILRVVTNGLIISELTLQQLPKLKTFGMSTWHMHGMLIKIVTQKRDLRGQKLLSILVNLSNWKVTAVFMLLCMN